MRARFLMDGVRWVGSVDWDRRVFDALIPTPDGTSYNAYLVEGSEKVALLDTVEPAHEADLRAHLEDVPRLDYLVSHHAEQDHSGCIPMVLEKYPEARLVVSPKARGMLMDLLRVPEDRFLVVEDGQELSLGNKTLRFIHTPWVHWPETMSTWLVEDRILFSCDMFGSHLATSDLFVKDTGRVQEAARRYFAEIMMPYRKPIEKNLAKLATLDIAMIAPSHGPMFQDPRFILDLYREWATAPPRNLVVIPYISMHESTARLVSRLTAALVERGVSVEPMNLTVVDLGKLAMLLIDAATIVVGSPTVLGAPHPIAAYAATLVNVLRPKAEFVSVVGSYSWAGKTVETLLDLLSGLRAETLEPVLSRGLPSESDLARIDNLAEQIATRHRERGFTG